MVKYKAGQYYRESSGAIYRILNTNSTDCDVEYIIADHIDSVGDKSCYSYRLLYQDQLLSKLEIALLNLSHDETNT